MKFLGTLPQARSTQEQGLRKHILEYNKKINLLHVYPRANKIIPLLFPGYTILLTRGKLRARRNLWTRTVCNPFDRLSRYDGDPTWGPRSTAELQTTEPRRLQKGGGGHSKG